jgi:hypothetical protein
MAIPKQNLPTYDVTLPSNGTVIQYRPFVMKEEKLLMMALEDGTSPAIIRAVHEIVGLCTDGKVDSASSPMFDIQYVFLQIRAKSVSEISDFVVHCGSCGEKSPTSIDITKINVQRVEGHERKIKLGDGLGVIMRYPVIRHLEVLTKSGTNPKEIYEVIADCIETIYTDVEVTDATKETRQDLLTFIDNLTLGQFNKLQAFFATMPVLRHEHMFRCKKCDKDNILSLEGIESFFV